MFKAPPHSRSRRRLACALACSALLILIVAEDKAWAAGSAPLDGRQPASADGGTLVVDRDGKGDYRSIGEALRKAPAGARILVRPGRYRESLFMPRSVHLQGAGTAQDVVVTAAGGPCLQITARAGSVRRMSFRAGPGSVYCVDVVASGVEMEHLVIVGADRNGTVALNLRDGAKPYVHHCRVQDSGGYGIFVQNGSRGRLESNEIAHNTVGMYVFTDADPLVVHNRIHGNTSVGIFSNDGSRGHFEANEIYGNAVGVFVYDEADPALIGNRIHGNPHGDLVKDDDALGTYRDNVLSH